MSTNHVYPWRPTWLGPRNWHWQQPQKGQPMPGVKKKKQKLSKVPSLGSDIATSGHLSYENHHSKDTCSPTFTAAETQTWENVHRQIKETEVHIHTQWTLPHPWKATAESVTSVTTGVDLGGSFITWCQLDRGRQKNLISLTGKIFKIYKGTNVKHKRIAENSNTKNQYQKSNNKGAGIKSEVLKNIYAGICNDNPCFIDHCLVVSKGLV